MCVSCPPVHYTGNIRPLLVFVWRICSAWIPLVYKYFDMHKHTLTKLTFANVFVQNVWFWCDIFDRRMRIKGCAFLTKINDFIHSLGMELCVSSHMFVKSHMIPRQNVPFSTISTFYWCINVCACLCLCLCIRLYVQIEVKAYDISGTRFIKVRSLCRGTSHRKIKIFLRKKNIELYSKKIHQHQQQQQPTVKRKDN